MKTNLSEYIYDVLIKEFGNELIHSSVEIMSLATNEYTETTKEIKKTIEKETVVKGFLGIPKTIKTTEEVTENVISKIKNKYYTSLNTIKSILYEDEFFVFSIDAVVFLTNKRMFFNSSSLYEVISNIPCTNDSWRRREIKESDSLIMKKRIQYKISDLNDPYCYFENVELEKMINLWALNKDENISDSYSIGKFRALNYIYSINDIDISKYYGTNNCIAYAVTFSTDENTYEFPFTAGYAGNNEKLKDILEIRTFLIFPSEKYLNLGKCLNKCLDDYVLVNTKTVKRDLLLELDKDNNGIVDKIDNNDFAKLLTLHQKKIIDINRDYIHNFVKISSYLNSKKKNIQSIFDCIKNSNSYIIINQGDILKNNIYNYEALLFHSINMIVALIEDDMITFYEIYETFDKLKIFNSNWEIEVSEKLSTIGNKLDDLLFSIYEMENKIVSEISNLSYVTQESFSDLNDSVTANLKDINSSIDVNNLFTMINTYQLYKINKQTKPLLPKN